MTYHYSYSSLNYSILTILIRWCVFYCIWNLWTLPQLESSAEHIDVSIRAHGNNNNTIFLKESLPVHVINGHKAVLISGLLELSSSQALDDSRTISEAKVPVKLDQTRYGDSLVQTSRELKDMSKSQGNAVPPKQRRLGPKHHRISRKKMQVQGQSINTKLIRSPPRRRKLRSNSTPNARRLRPVPRQTSSLGESYAPFDEQTKHRTSTSTFVLLAFSGALIGGGAFAVKALKRMEKWEIQSQEDSLAYDIAYTSRSSESSYGSFYEHSWQGDLSKFDV